ncbi:MAG: SDR family oxidoreductase [Anaerolineae bacterium]
MTTISLNDKVALVTGSARRVGRAIALELAAQGMHVVIHHNHSDEEAKSVAAEARKLGVKAAIVRADLGKPKEIAALFQKIEKRFGRLDVLVNSASIFAKGLIENITLQEWQQALDINLTAPFLCSQHAAKLMRQNGNDGGSIVNILDLSAFAPWKTFAPQSVSKAGLKMLTDVLALSLAPQIRVNAVAPGPVLRDEGNSPERWKEIGERLPMKQTGDPADVAQAVVFLASQPFMTGAVLHVDGGEHLQRHE